jgi:alkylation response protein AidB-like acyl-CoA dehydrogenase
VIVDMKAPGIRIRPLPELTGPDHVDFNEVFFDDVVVPRDHLVGPLNQGWSITAGSLAHERGMIWLSSAARLDRTIDQLRELAHQPGPDGRRLGDDASFRDELAGLYVDAQAMWFMGYRGFTKFARGQVSPEHSVLKLFGTELEQRAAQLATEAAGVDALDVEFEGCGYDASHGRLPWMMQYLRTYRGTISAGTSEIQRNIIGQRVLDLPRR